MNVIGFERRHRTSHFAATLLAVSDRDHAAELHGLHGEGKVERHTLSLGDGDRERDRRITDQTRLHSLRAGRNAAE